MRFKEKIEGVTLVAISGVNISDTIYALWRSQLFLEFSAIKLITDSYQSIEYEWLDIVVLPDFKLDSIDAYSYFCVYELHKYISTDFALVIQADGYIIHPKLWDNDFLKYDYIGAPWPVSESSYIDPYGVHQRVGNGGFSLRSARLLKVPRLYPVEWNINESSFYKHMGYGLQSEDGIICIHNRNIYEKAGCVYAPVLVASKFSTEIKINESRKSFGFHKNLPTFTARFIDLFYRFAFHFITTLRRQK